MIYRTHTSFQSFPQFKDSGGLATQVVVFQLMLCWSESSCFVAGILLQAF